MNKSRDDTDAASPIANWNRYWQELPRLSKPSPVIDQILLTLGGRIEGARILEIGAGSGRDIVALAKLGADAHALDKSPIACQRISELAGIENVPVKVCENDLRETNYPSDYFDVVYSQGVVEHFKDVAPIIKEQRRLIKSQGGIVVIDVPQTFNPYTIYKHLRMLAGTWPPGWETQFSPADLRRFGRRYGLSLLKIYAWGEHGPTLGRVLSLLDKNPWTATCIGGIYVKRQ